MKKVLIDDDVREQEENDGNDTNDAKKVIYEKNKLFFCKFSFYGIS
jgi:hypothetical protein